MDNCWKNTPLTQMANEIDTAPFLPKKLTNLIILSLQVQKITDFTPTNIQWYCTQFNEATTINIILSNQT